MIYKYDPSKKKSYILRCFALNTIFYMLFVIFILLVEIFTKSSNKSFVITYGILLLLVSCITTFKRYTIYNKIEFEIGDSFLEIRSPQKTTRIEFSEISGIKKRKYLFGLEECRIVTSNYKAILITNNIENYDERPIKPMKDKNTGGFKIGSIPAKGCYKINCDVDYLDIIMLCALTVTRVDYYIM